MELELGLGDTEFGEACFRCALDILFAAFRCRLARAFLRTDRPLEVVHNLREVVDAFLDHTEDLPLCGVTGKRFGVHPKMVEHRTQTGQHGDRVEFPAFDAFDHLLERDDVDHRVGGVKLLRVHTDGAALEQEDVFQFGDLCLDVHAVLFRLGGVERGVVVTHHVCDNLMDEALLADLVEVREKLDEAAESDRAERGVACTNGAGGVCRVVVDGLDRLGRDAALRDTAMELGDERVVLRAVADALEHLADKAIPRRVEQIDVRGCTARRFLHGCFRLKAVAVGLPHRGDGELAATLGHPVLDLVEHGHGRVREVRLRDLDDLDAFAQDGERAVGLERKLVESLVAVRLHHDGTGEHRGIRQHAHQAVVKLDKRVEDVTESPDAVERAVPDAVAEEHERLVHGLVV